MIYAGDNGGCMGCDSTAGELADKGHRKGCRSPHANEPPRPAAERARRRREEAKRLCLKAIELEAEADELAPVLVVSIGVTPTNKPGLFAVRSATRVSHYYDGEAQSSAVYVALEQVTRQIGRGEIEAGDGFTVRVEFVTVDEDREVK